MKTSFLAFYAVYANKGGSAGANQTETKADDKSEGTISERALATLTADDNMPETLKMGDGTSWEVAGLVTREQMKVENDVVYAITFQTKIADPDRDADGNIRKSNGMDAPYTAVIIDLKDGVEKNVIVNAVFLSSITKSYPDHAYVGKSFLFKRTKSQTGKRYSNFDIREIRPKTIEHQK